MKGFFFPVHWPENHPNSLYETLGEMGGWVYVAKPYLLVVYLSSQLRDLRSVYTGGPKPSTEGGPKTLTLEQASPLFLVLGKLYRYLCS